MNHMQALRVTLHTARLQLASRLRSPESLSQLYRLAVELFKSTFFILLSRTLRQIFNMVKFYGSTKTRQMVNILEAVVDKVITGILLVNFLQDAHDLLPITECDR